MVFEGREILLKIEKNKRRAERADQKYVNNLMFGSTNFKCLAAKHVMFGNLLEHVFFFVSCPRLDTTDGI